jgi:hypothetical protein
MVQTILVGGDKEGPSETLEPDEANEIKGFL